MEREPELLDVVELAVPAGGWPVGTVGTLVEAYSDGGIVEIDSDGNRIDLVALPYTAMLRRGYDAGSG
jgi:hypothetical protein